MTPLTTALIVGTVIAVHDGDGPIRIRTDAGQVVPIRLRGLQAPDFEDAPPCREHRAGYVCDDRLAKQSRDRMAARVMGKRLTCRTEGRSWKRVNAWCEVGGVDLTCEAIRLRIGWRWPKYWPAGKECG